MEETIKPPYGSRPGNTLAVATQHATDLNTKSAGGVFHYSETLRQGWIRLLHLHPGSGSDPVICSLSGAPLAENLEPFEAVSYVWGDETAPHKITCNWRVPWIEDGKLYVSLPKQVTDNFSVTDNLYRVLLRFRRVDQPRTLWIDQICINQSDLEEKPRQIRMMSEIYSAADNVLIWLGEEDSDTETAFGVMDWMCATNGLTMQQVAPDILFLLQTEDFSAPEAGVPVERREEMKALKRLLVDYVQPTYISDLYTPDHPGRVSMCLRGSRALTSLLLERAWFRRAWTFQETVSARRATVICGAHERSWDTLYGACQSLLSQPMRREPSWSGDDLALLIQNVVKKGDLRLNWARLMIINSRRSSETPEDQDAKKWLLESGNIERDMEQRRIKSLLPLIRPTGARDPRDKVLAVLGISHDDGRWIEFPDYKWPVVNLYIAITKYWVSSYKLLDISFLNHVQESNPDHNLPSWVPDWSCPAIATIMADLGTFKAAGNSKADVAMDNIDLLSDLEIGRIIPRLGVEGFPILQVAAVDHDPKNYERHADMISPFDDPYPTTLLPYPDAYQIAANPLRPEDFQAPKRTPGSLGFWESVCKQAEKSPEAGKLQIGVKSRYTAQDLQSHTLSYEFEFNTAAGQPMLRSGRAFFVSTTGFMGLVPKDAVPGDEVFIFLGADVPFVVRKLQNGFFKFLGECYVYGLMHGEAMEGLAEEKKKEIILI